MAACSNYKNRLKAALEYRGLEYPLKIIDVIGKRATSDRELDGIILSITDILEPPNCKKSHCPHFTTFAFCNCSKKLVPGKCKLNIAYLKGVQQRLDAISEPIIKEMQELYGISPEDAITSFERLKNSAGGISRVKGKWNEYKLSNHVE